MRIRRKHDKKELIIGWVPLLCEQCLQTAGDPTRWHSSGTRRSIDLGGTSFQDEFSVVHRERTGDGMAVQLGM